MATYTPNYNLKKPDEQDFYDVKDFNDNADIIDEALESKVEKEEGKGLSTNDFTNEAKNKVDNSPSNVQQELNAKADKTAFENHAGSSTMHTSTAEKNTWNGKMNKVSNPTNGNLVAMDSNGQAINSGKKVSDFLEKAGGTMGGSLVLHHDPVQDMEAATKKYADEHGGGFKPLIVVTAPTGSTVKAIKGTTVLTGTEVSGTWNFDIPEYGTWTIQATKGTSSKEVSVVVDSVKQFDVEIQYYHVWGVSINQANSNPETACTYTDDAVGMTPGSSEWDTLFKYRPCLLVNGVVNKYLNPNNYAQDIDGNAVDITTVGNDVMVEFPKMGYKITTSGDTTLVQVTDNPNADGFCYKPFSRNAIGDRDYFYYGAYKSYSTGNKLYSSSGKTPTANKTRATYRSEATARGTGYFQNGFYQLIFLQCLYLLKYKNRNSQAALGYGYVGGSAAQQTGATNTKGLNYGNTSSQTDRVKLFGIEDMWGNIWQWMDGLSTDGSRKYVVTHLPVNFDDATSGTAHTTYDSGITADLGNYISRVQGTTDCGFAAKQTSGSETTYWADYAHVKASCVAVFGGRWDSGAVAGVFRLNVDHAASYSGANVASRLMYV